jgi:sugar lactone lactonase YvrE
LGTFEVATSAPDAAVDSATPALDVSVPTDATADTSSNDAGPTCAPGQAPCGQTCVDLQTNEQNCGRCGRSCGGSGCEKGACAKLVLATAEKPHGIAIDDTEVYFTTYNGGGSDFVATVSKKPGNALTKLAERQDLPSLLAIANKRVYWTNWSTGHVRSAGAPLGQFIENAQLPSGSGAPFGIVATGASVFAVSYDTGNVYSIPVTQGTPTEVGKTAKSATSMAALNNSLFVTAQNNPGAGLYRVNPATKESMNLAAGARAWGVAAAGTSVYFSDHIAGTITRIALGGGGGITVIAKNLGAPRGVAVDNTHVYWADFGTGSIARVPRDAQAVTPEEVIATGLSGVTSIALDANFVYFAALNAGVVGKVAK